MVLPLTCPAAWCAADGSRFLFSVLGAWLSALGYQNSLLLFLCLRSAPGSLSAHRLASTLGVQATERSRADFQVDAGKFGIRCIACEFILGCGLWRTFVPWLFLDAHKFAPLAYPGVFDIYVYFGSILVPLSVVRHQRHYERRTWAWACAEYLQSQCASGMERRKSEISPASLSAAPPPLVEADASH